HLDGWRRARAIESGITRSLEEGPGCLRQQHELADAPRTRVCFQLLEEGTPQALVTSFRVDGNGTHECGCAMPFECGGTDERRSLVIHDEEWASGIEIGCRQACTSENRMDRVPILIGCQTNLHWATRSTCSEHSSWPPKARSIRRSAAAKARRFRRWLLRPPSGTSPT